MAAEPHIDGWTQITVWWSDLGGQHSNVFAYKSTTQPGPIDVNTIAANFWSYVGTAFRNCLGSTRNVDRIECKTRWTGVNYAGVFYPTQPAPGNVTGDASPGNAAVVTSYKSGARGRSFNGRSFLGGLTEGSLSGDVVSSALILNMNTLAGLILAFSNSGSLPMTFSVASVRHLVLTNLFKFVIDAVVDSQRRRLTGRGQ